MKLLDYLIGDDILIAGNEYVISNATQDDRTLVQDDYHGFAMACNGKIISAWYKVTTLKEFNAAAGIHYKKKCPQHRYLKPGDIVHYNKDDERVVIKIHDHRFGFLNLDDYKVTLVFNTEFLEGITFEDFKQTGYVISDSATLTRRRLDE